MGIRPAAIRCGWYEVLGLLICYGAMLALLAGIGVHHELGLAYYLGLAVAAGFRAYHYRLIHGRGREDCFKAFNHNNWVGGAVFAGLFADLAIRPGTPLF